MVFPILFSTSAKADAVTDYLSVAVGYSGMELWEYVEVGDYHWSELANDLPIYEQAYSYYNSRSDDGTEFTEIVDSARGILLTDFLEYANIHYPDIYNLQFYVVDHNDIQAAFDRDALFQTRYYFEDYNGHLYREYDENFNVTSVDSSECWNYSYAVEPMLALEDNWVSFTEEYEHSLPDYENMTTASRFRLLFGQTNPEESLTSKSAKYVRTVYVTLTGKPEITGEGGGELPELDGSYGSHTYNVEIEIHTDIASEVEQLEQLLHLESTDESVLQITGINVTKDDFYENVVQVAIDYQIIGEGEASIVGSFGSLKDGDTGFTFSKPVAGSAEDPAEQPDEKQETDDNSEEDQISPETDHTNDTNQRQNADQSQAGHSGAESTDSENRSADASSGNVTGKVAAGDTKQSPNQNEIQQIENSDTLQVRPDETETLDTTSVSSGVFRLSSDIQAQLADNRVARADAGVAETEDVSKVTVEDHKQEKNERMRLMLMISGIGTAGLLALGLAGEKLAFYIGTKN